MRRYHPQGEKFWGFREIGIDVIYDEAMHCGILNLSCLSVIVPGLPQISNSKFPSAAAAVNWSLTADCLVI